MTTATTTTTIRECEQCHAAEARPGYINCAGCAHAGWLESELRRTAWVYRQATARADYARELQGRENRAGGIVYAMWQARRDDKARRQNWMAHTERDRFAADLVHFAVCDQINAFDAHDKIAREIAEAAGIVHGGPCFRGHPMRCAAPGQHKAEYQCAADCGQWHRLPH